MKNIQNFITFIKGEGVQDESSKEKSARIDAVAKHVLKHLVPILLLYAIRLTAGNAMGAFLESIEIYAGVLFIAIPLTFFISLIWVHTRIIHVIAILLLGIVLPLAYILDFFQSDREVQGHSLSEMMVEEIAWLRKN